MKERIIREILPASGIWTVQDLAFYLGTNPGAIQQKLSDWGVKTFSFSNRFGQRCFRLEDLKSKVYN